MIVWMGPKKFRVVSRAISRTSPPARAFSISRKQLDRLLPGRPLGLAAEQVFLGDHLQHRADVLRHAAVDQHEAVADQLPGPRRDLLLRIDMMVGQQAAEADAVFRIAGLGRAAFDHLHARPDAAGILPSAAGTAQPFAQDRPRGDQLSFRFAERAGERARLAGRPHADGDDGCQQVRRDGQAGTLGDVVHLADDFQPQPRSDQLGQHVGQRLAGAFQPGRNDAGGDHGRLEQPEIVLGEIEDVGQGGDVGLALQVDARQAEHRLVDDAEPGLDRRLRLGVAAADAQVDRDVQHACPLGKIHAQEEDVAPAAVREVHADRRPLDEDRKGLLRRRRGVSVPGGSPADGRPDGPCETSTGCRGPSGRCGGPGRPGFESPGPGRRRPGRWRWRRWGRAALRPRGSHRSLLRNAGPRGACSLRTAPGPWRYPLRVAAVWRAGDSDKWRPERTWPAPARIGSRSGGERHPAPGPPRPVRPRRPCGRNHPATDRERSGRWS